MTTTNEKIKEKQFNSEIQELFKEVNSNPEDLIAKITLASALERENYYTEATQIYREIIELEPEGVFAASAAKALENLGLNAHKTEQIAAEITPEVSEKINPLTKTLKFLGKQKQAITNIPLSYKQFISLVTSSIISIVAVGGAGIYITLLSGRSQLRNQASAELAVTVINYNDISKSMESGFRGQADNIAIIDIAQKYQNNRQIYNQEKELVKKILVRELQARRLEYVTLVGLDGKIIVNGNKKDRQGEEFNPNGLVKSVLQSPRRIKTNAVFSGAEIKKEAPILPANITNQDVLVRLNFTPVENPNTGQTIALLIGGDVVNGNNLEIEETVKSVGGGYGAIYYKNQKGDYKIAASALEIPSTKGVLGGEFKNNLEIPDLSLIADAEQGVGGTLIRRMKIEKQNYTLAVTALQNYDGKRVAFLVRGTPEIALNQLLQNSFRLQLGIAGLTFILVGGLALLIGWALTSPIKALQKAAQQIASGDLTARAEVKSLDEVGQLALTFNEMTEQINLYTKEIENQALERQKEAETQRKEKEKLQQSVIELLLEIEETKKGDLTLRAKVDQGEVGSIADAFNTTIASLDELVSKVKNVAFKVHNSSLKSGQSVQNLSQEAVLQATAIKTAVDSVEAIALAISQVSENTQIAANISHTARLAAQKGEERMDKTVTSIDNIRNSVADTSKKAKRLADSSQEIAKILNIISDISEKTNLLAFNASIEASRAGEHGQGFRIVADEVRRLAERVTFSTQEIEQLITGIQEETGEMLKMMEESTTQVVTGTKLIRQTKTTLQKLAQINEEIDKLLKSIAENTVSQRADSQKVSETMQSVEKVARNTATNSEIVSLSLQELVETAQELEKSASRFQVTKP